MNGVKYYRLMLGLSIKKLSQLSGVSITSIANMERAVKPHGISLENYKKVKEILGVPADKLFQHDYSVLKEYSRVRYISKTANEWNCITFYRSVHGLTFEELAHRLGVTSRECGRQACAAKEPLEKHVRVLAAYETMSVEEFKEIYYPDIKSRVS